MVGMSWMRKILRACRSTFDGLLYSNCQRGVILGNFVYRVVGTIGISIGTSIFLLVLVSYPQFC